MTTSAAPPRPAPDSSPSPRPPGLFAAFWRWHFYASVLVLPVLAILAVTGLVYLFRWTIDPLVFPELTVRAAGEQMVPLAEQQRAAEQAVDGEATMVTEASGDRASLFAVTTADGTERNVYVDPWTGEVTGSLAATSLPSDVAVRLHGELMAGRWGDYVIELAACWAIVMTITGYYLVVRGRRARRLRDARNGRRLGLRSGHAVVGSVAGVGILFLVLSGLPWTALWGETVQEWAAPRGASLWGEDPGAASTLGERLEQASGSSAAPGWAISGLPLATSAAPGGTPDDGENHPDHRHHGGPGTADPSAPGEPTVDAVVAAAVADGLAGPFTVTYPDGPEGVYSVMASQWYDPEQRAFSDVTSEATVHVDRYSGEVLARYGYDDYSPAAQVVSQAIALHEGRRFGLLTTVTTTAFCLGVLFLCVSAPIMWWRRRPARAGLAAPRGRLPLRTTPWLAAALVVLGLLLPVFGVSVAVLLLLDHLLVRRVPALRRALSVT